MVHREKKIKKESLKSQLEPFEEVGKTPRNDDWGSIQDSDDLEDPEDSPMVWPPSQSIQSNGTGFVRVSKATGRYPRFEKYWKLYLKTLIQGGLMLTGQTQITKQSLNDLLFQQVHFCNKVLLCAALATSDQFEDMMASVSAGPGAAPGLGLGSIMGVSVDNIPFQQGLSEVRRKPSNGEWNLFDRRSAMHSNANELEQHADNSLFREFCRPANVTGRPMAYGEFKFVEDDSSPIPQGFSDPKYFTLINEWARNSSLIRKQRPDDPSELLEMPSPRRLPKELAAKFFNNNETPFEIPRGFSNSSVLLTTFSIPEKEPHKDPQPESDEVFRMSFNEFMAEMVKESSPK